MKNKVPFGHALHFVSLQVALKNGIFCGLARSLHRENVEFLSITTNCHKVYLQGQAYFGCPL